ncbi:hypothetical protein OG625_14030 [Streptomyces sp. NBC_01351]|uniref:hypothetical protein n=1 Tax=Streptomyces sp. NBC_01351 TaxID=2903833 RepID=UPI002E318DAE|nr:hypothetical protein [Streptomyces sp. NBC_01351]
MAENAPEEASAENVQHPDDHGPLAAPAEPEAAWSGPGVAPEDAEQEWLGPTAAPADTDESAEGWVGPS